MKINKYTSVIVLLLILSMASCYEDIGNYDYDRIAEIDISGIEINSGSRELFVDSLIIKPIIKLGDEGNEAFSGEWFRKTSSGLVLVSEDINLNLQMTQSGRSEYLLRLTYDRLGLTYFRETRVDVSSAMERGYYILKETADGNTDMDAFLRVSVDTLKENFNLISATLGEPLLGKPVDVDYWDWLWRNEVEENVVVENRRVIRPMSEKELAIFDIKDFSYLGDLDKLLGNDIPMEERNLEALISVQELTTLIYNGGRMQSFNNSSGNFGMSRFVGEFPGDYELEPCLSAQPRATGSGIFFDKKSGSIVGLSSATKSNFNIFPDAAITFYPSFGMNTSHGTVNNLDVNLKYCGSAYSGKPISPLGRTDGTGYFLVEKKQSPDSLLLYKLSQGPISGGMYESFLTLMSIDTLQNTHNLKMADHYSMNRKGEFLYFSVGSKVYYYNYEHMEDEELLDFGGEEITYLRHIRWLTDSPEFNFDCLLVGTFSGGKYKLHFHNMQGALPIGGVKHVLEGEGRIKSFVYANPGLSGSIADFGIYQ